MIDPVVDHTARLALGLLLMAAAGHKLADLPRFRATFAAYRLAPGVLAPLVPALEIGAALFLLVGWSVGSLAAAALFAAYATAIAVNLVRGRRTIDCGCVGSAGRHGLGWELVGRNALLGLVACATLAPVTARAVGWIDVTTIAGGVIALAALYAAADGLLANLDGYRRLREAT